MYTFLLDNSAFNEVLRESARTDDFIKQLSISPHRVVVSIDTITENFAGQVQYVASRVPNLKKIIDVVPHDRFIISSTVWSWLKREKGNRGRLNNIPMLINSGRWPGFLKFLEDIEGFRRFHQELEPARKEQARLQGELKESDKVFREKAKHLSDLKEVQDNLLNFELNPYSSHLKLFAGPLGISKKFAKKVICAPSDLYKIHRSYLAALYLRSLGNAFFEYDKYPGFKFLQKIKDGNWFDLSIVAQASQFDFLVSNDNDQREICNFLHSKKIVKARAIRIEEFFRLLQERRN